MFSVKKNRGGGCFSYKISNKNVSNVWKELSYILSGETISNDHKFGQNVNGITISPKKAFCIIKIWMSNCQYQDPQKISPNEATEYLTTSGRSFSRYISIVLHKLVHLMKYPRFLRENSP